MPFTKDDLDELGKIPVPGESQNVPRGTIPAPVSPLPAIIANSQGLGAQAQGTYTPERRNELYAEMLQRQNGMPSAIAGGLASVGDAISRGYGRTPTDFLKTTQEGAQNATQQGLGAFDVAQKGKMAQLQTGMEMGKLDPTSEISKISQQAYEGPLLKLGYKKEDLARMPASQIESVAQVALKYGDIQAQKELKEATLQLQTMVAAAAIDNQKAERAQAAKNAELDANKETAKHYLTHPIAAYKAGKAIAAAGQPSLPSSQTFATEADAEKANLADGTPIVVGGVKGTWRHK